MLDILLAFAVAMAPAAVPAETAPCPAPVMRLPRYPAEMMRSNVSGTTLVMATIDDCGRVIEASVDTSSGRAALDAAALETVSAWVLSPAQRAKIKGSRVKLPVSFGGVTRVVERAPAWPKSHRRPRYLPDESPIGFDSVKAFYDAERRKPDVVRSPYGTDPRTGVMTIFAEDMDDPMVFWLSYAALKKGQTIGESTVAVARYHLVEEQGEPVVRLALLCELEPKPCEDLRGFLLKGLPIAKARRD
jgi:TonB family protein